MMEAAIKHQSTYYKIEMPSLMKDMEELEKRRLKEVERALQAYAALYQEQLLPAEQLSNKLSTAIGHMNPAKDWERWSDRAGITSVTTTGTPGTTPHAGGVVVNSAAAAALANITPPKLNYDLPCSADDIHSGIWVDAIKNFRVRNKAARQQDQSGSSPDGPNAPIAGNNTSSSNGSNNSAGSPGGSTPLDPLGEEDYDDFDALSDGADSDDDVIESPLTKETRSAAVIGKPGDEKEKGSELLGRGWLHVRDEKKNNWNRRYISFNQIHTAIHMYTRTINPNLKSVFCHHLISHSVCHVIIICCV
jgi:hypothetical protein